MKFRKPLKITSRTSTITNSFVQAIIPSIEPTESEVREALAILEIDPKNMTCAYCGRPSTDWDHLHPLVRNKRPTGFINELRNMVHSCGPCNQSKSGQDWRSWMSGKSSGSPNTRGVSDLQDRIGRLERYEGWGNLRPLALDNLVPTEDWEAHWHMLDSISSSMRDAQSHAEKVRRSIENALKPRNY